MDENDRPDPEALNALLERHNLPRFRSLEALQVGGAPSDTFLLDNQFVLHLNRADAGRTALAKEALVYRRLRRSTDVPCPEVVVWDTSRDPLPYDVLITRQVSGVNGAAVWPEIDPAAREALSEEVGRMCGAIHGLQWPAYGDLDVDTGIWGQYSRWPDLILQRVQRAARQALATGVLPRPIIDAIVTELNDADGVLESATRPVLVHGALHPSALILDQRGEAWHVAAILDWAAALTADAAGEWGMLAYRGWNRGLLGDALLYGYRERHPLQSDLRLRMRLYRLLWHLEDAVSAAAQPATETGPSLDHEAALRKLLRKD